MKNVFSSGDVARICNVSPRCACKWIDSGKIVSYRIPGGNHRRVAKEELIKFMKSNNIPLNGLNEDAVCRVLVLGLEKRLFDNLKAKLPDQDEYSFDLCDSLFLAGSFVEKFSPDALVIDLAIGRDEAASIAESVASDRLRDVALVAIVNDDEIRPDELRSCGFTDIIRKPLSISDLVQIIKDCGKKKRLSS